MTSTQNRQVKTRKKAITKSTITSQNKVRPRNPKAIVPNNKRQITEQTKKTAIRRAASPKKKKRSSLKKSTRSEGSTEVQASQRRLVDILDTVDVQFCEVFHINQESSYTSHAQTYYREACSSTQQRGLKRFGKCNEARLWNPFASPKLLSSVVQFPATCDPNSYCIGILICNLGTDSSSESGGLRVDGKGDVRSISYSFSGELWDGFRSYKTTCVQNGDVVVLLSNASGCLQVYLNGELQGSLYTCPPYPWQLSWFGVSHGAQVRILNERQVRDSTAADMLLHVQSSEWFSPCPTRPPTIIQHRDTRSVHCHVVIDCNSDDDEYVAVTVNKISKHLLSSLGRDSVSVVENPFGLSRTHAGTFEVYVSIAVDGKRIFHEVVLHSRLKSFSWPSMDAIDDSIASLIRQALKTSLHQPTASYPSYSNHSRHLLASLVSSKT